MMPCDNVSKMVAIPLSTYKQQSCLFEYRLLWKHCEWSFNYFGM